MDGSLVREIRKRRGLSQRELATLAGLSLSYVRKLEQGTLPGTRVQTFRKIAMALRVPTSRLLAERETVDDADPGTADQWQPVRRALEGRHPAATEPPTVDGVRDAVNAAMPLFATNAYPQLAIVLPPLLRDADALQAEGRAVRAFLLRMTGWVLTHLGQYEAAELALRRALDDADDRLEVAACARIRCWLLLHTGHLDQCWDNGIRWADGLEPRISAATPADLSAWGWLQMHNSAAAMRDNRPGDADDAMKMARAAAARIGSEYSHRVDFLRTFGPVTVAMKHAENLMVDDKPDKVLAAAAAIRPCATRATKNNRNRHLLDVANAHTRIRDYPEALTVLTALRADAPEWLPKQREAHEVMRTIVTRRRTLTPQMRDLADHIGLSA
jgi:transcriptional regulator with XRE-family HTH domain